MLWKEFQNFEKVIRTEQYHKLIKSASENRYVTITARCNRRFTTATKFITGNLQEVNFTRLMFNHDNAFCHSGSLIVIFHEQ